MRRLLPRILVFCLAGLIIHLWALLGALVFGRSFVPSQAYVSDHDIIAKSIAIPAGCLIFVLCCRKFAKDFEAPQVSVKTLLLSGFGVVVLPFVFGVFIRATVLTAYPLWSAALIGKETQLEFSVYDTGGPSFRCPNRVNLAGMPTMTGTLCDVPDDFRRTLHQGIRVVLTGRGTANGLFAARIEVVH
ncbi:hypothetical protein [Mesorhizobium sp.]|uniref:hypothetical protein n=1 Tax=Mesorhizobium sp. TaxID=1871066 RepID=UPI000FE8386C|nr:hypothetical protein [Mesorhizobium sp.]RWM26227.1 MAG: hypothetical protein EOR74_16415 [Mesorhizobium sp.]RWM41485.1 MAG: hypothetical protein EOR75_05230 [Mesorhizobium sp.]TIO78761.1 MAG: hypothetical protein E5X75_06445 [Mesorhizobium sp.]TIO87587.1 MAG: hypothetical protein E5X74_00795 [Mesorhizobium sp.]TJV54301.1 MAG: hypothetical protein E5Y01_02105 [Mesorhizobium sp.]